MKTTAPRTLRVFLGLLVLALGSGCRGMQIRQLEHRIDQLESRVSNLEGRLAAKPEPEPPHVRPSS